jgi:O-antigen/teichoic acid export membrane protein
MRYVPSPTVLSMAVYGASGLAFVGANLLLARALSTEQYALLTLLVALVTVGHHLAPMGLDAVVTRGRVDVDWALLMRAAAVAAGVGVAVGLISFLLYGLSAATAMWLLAGTAAGGVMLVAGARFQSQHRFLLSLALIMSQNAVLLFGAVVVIASGSQTADLPFHILTIGLGLAAVLGWALVLRERRRQPSTGFAGIPWNEALTLAGVSAAGMLFIQLERLVLPHVLTVADLALFGVLGAIAGSVFRILQMAVGFTLLPRLRSAATVLERRELIARELRFALVIAGAGAVCVLVFAPLIERWFLAGKYHLPMTLLVAALFSGFAKIAHAFARATATALATPRELALVNGAGWVSLTLAIGASIVAAPWGLTGVIYGVGVGWLAWAIAAFALVMHHLRLPAAAPVRGRVVDQKT